MRWRSSPSRRRPVAGRRLTQQRVETLLRKAGRQRNLTTKATQIRAALASDQLPARPGVVSAYTASVSALVAVITVMVTQTEVLAGQVEQGLASTRTLRSTAANPASV